MAPRASLPVHNCVLRMGFTTMLRQSETFYLNFVSWLATVNSLLVCFRLTVLCAWLWGVAAPIRDKMTYLIAGRLFRFVSLEHG